MTYQFYLCTQGFTVTKILCSFFVSSLMKTKIRGAKYKAWSQNVPVVTVIKFIYETAFFLCGYTTYVACITLFSKKLF